MTYIYILPRNNIPFYVGKSVNPIRRIHKHYVLYGKNIEVSIIDQVNSKLKEDWKPLECYWIEQFKQWDFKLVNDNKGGGGPSFWSEKQKFEINPQRIEKIKNHKTRGSKISKTLLENNHSKYYTQKIKNKMSINAKGSHSGPFTDLHINNIKISRRKTSKRVIQLSLQNEYIKEWLSKGEAAEWIKEQTGKNSNIVSQIKDCILGRQKTAFGYKWKYKI